MVSSLIQGGLALLSFVAPLLLLLLAFPPFLRYLSRIGWVSEDVHKTPPTRVPEPVGPILFVAMLVGELIVAVGFSSIVPLALIAGAGIAFAVGLADDVYVLGGKTKPLLLVLAGLGFIGFIAASPDLYQPVLSFPLLGDTSAHFIIFTALAVIAFPVVTNAFNMMDSFNGEVSWFALLTSLALLAGVVLHEVNSPGLSMARVASVLPLVAVAAGFLAYNRYPAKGFDGDSGSLMFGAMFVGLAISCGVEVAAMIAIVPAILNSFYTLSSVRGFVERRRMASRPTYIGADGLLHASTEKGAPITLVRLVLLSSPLSEKDLVKSIVALTAVACVFSVVISILTWVY